MSFSLAVENGDLALLGSEIKLIWGVDLLKQNLDLWLRERFGIDRFHPTMGSTLEDFIGGIVSPGVKAQLQSEVLRVLQNYQAIQQREIQQSPKKYSLSELLYSVDDIVVSVSYDTVIVTLKVSTASGITTTINAQASA